jgi:hypothetical protein
VPESKRDLANKELKETESIILSQEVQDETSSLSQSSNEDNLTYSSGDNNYNVNINLSTNKNVSQQEVKNLVNNVVNNEQVTSSEDLKKNSQENLSQGDGYESDPNFVGPPSSLMGDSNTEENQILIDESDPNFVGPPSSLMEDPEADQIHPQIDYPYEPFHVSSPMTFTPETFSSLPVSAYSITQKKELPSSIEMSYQEVNRIVERSLEPISSGGAVISPYFDELPKTILGVESYNLEIESPTNTEVDMASKESKISAANEAIRDETVATGINEIAKSTSKTATQTELSTITPQNTQSGVQFQSSQGTEIRLYPGDNSLGLFGKEKNSSPNWRTVSS